MFFLNYFFFFLSKESILEGEKKLAENASKVSTYQFPSFATLKAMSFVGTGK